MSGVLGPPVSPIGGVDDGYFSHDDWPALSCSENVQEPTMDRAEVLEVLRIIAQHAEPHERAVNESTQSHDRRERARERERHRSAAKALRYLERQLRQRWGER